jgi:hypothetical protein
MNQTVDDFDRKGVASNISGQSLKPALARRPAPSSRPNDTRVFTSGLTEPPFGGNVTGFFDSHHRNG